MSHDSLGNTDPQRGASDADAMQKGEKSFLDHFSGLSEALSNDENGFSNKEGFNTDRGHEPLADNESEAEINSEDDELEFRKERSNQELPTEEQNRRSNLDE